MLEKIHQSAKGLLSWGIVLLIGLSFALWGVNDYFSGERNRNVAAKVNGEKISWRSIDALYERMRRQFGNAQVDEQAFREQLRLALIQRAALLSSARSLGFRVGDEQIAETLVKIPSFQIDGKFSKDRYFEVLGKAAYTDMNFRQELAQDVLLSQLEQGLIQSNFALPSETSRMVGLLNQQRNFGYLILPLQKYQSGIKISPDDLKSYYEKHAAQFVLPQQVSVEYVELSLDQLAKQQQLSETELKDFYEQHLESYSAPERLRVRHILIPVTSSAKEADEEARNKAQDLLTKIKNGSDFVTLAKTHSVDTGSAKNGGDLGWFARGQMVPEFEKAAFGLAKPMEVAGPIHTQYGYHILQLIERKPAETQSFAEVRELVLEQMQREKAYILFAEMGEKMAKIAFENTSSLEPVAKNLGLKIQETPLFAQTPADGQAELSPEFIKHPAVLEAAFSDFVLKQKNNSEPLSVGNFQSIVLRVKQHQPAVQQSLAQVSKKIEARLIDERAKEKVQEVAQSIQKKLRAGETPSQLASHLNLPWTVKTEIDRSAKNIDKTILESVFLMPHRLSNEKQCAVNAFPLSSGDYVVLLLDKVIPGDLSKADENIQKAYRKSMIERGAQLEFALYANRVFNEAKIEITEQPSS